MLPCGVLQKDTLQVERLLQKGEQRLKEKLHPDPIIGVPLAFSRIPPHISCLKSPSSQLALLLTSLSPVVPYYPGGSLFERNPPMPKVCMFLTTLFKRGPLRLFMESYRSTYACRCNSTSTLGVKATTELNQGRDMPLRNRQKLRRQCSSLSLQAWGPSRSFQASPQERRLQRPACLQKSDYQGPPGPV